jgi:hypothetical protein
MLVVASPDDYIDDMVVARRALRVDIDDPPRLRASRRRDP